jgi:hypothetical protein
MPVNARGDVGTAWIASGEILVSADRLAIAFDAIASFSVAGVGIQYGGAVQLATRSGTTARAGSCAKVAADEYKARRAAKAARHTGMTPSL